MKKINKINTLLLAFLLAVSISACGARSTRETTGEQTATAVGSEKKTAESTTEKKSTVKATIRLGRVGVGLGAVDAAINDGSYAKAGLTIEKHVFNSGADAIAALIGGSLDLNLGSYEHVLRQINNGLDVKAFALLSNSAGYQVVVKSNAPYQKLDDLKGKVIGVTKVGSLSDTTLRKILNDVGINPEKDVQIINAGTGSTMMAALESGKIAAGMVNDPVRSQMIVSGNYKILYNPDFETAGLVVMGRSKWAKENAEVLKEFLRVTKEEIAKIKANPESFVSVFKKDFPDLEDKILLEAIKNTISNTPSDLIVTKASADEVLETQLKLGNIRRRIDIDEGFDASYLPK